MTKETKEKIDLLKNKYPEGIHEGEISFNDPNGKLHKVEFIFRQPTTADIESHLKAQNKNPIVANLNLVQSLIVSPEPGPIIDIIRDFPASYGRFVDEAITPFLGANVTIRTRKL
jgi:hypothetical protein